MAICYARMQFVKRASGKCIVAKSAYNGKIKIQFEGNCVLPARNYDWSQSPQPISHRVILPENVEQVFSNPKDLWNTVERMEKRKDAQVGKEVVLALPDDDVISNEQRIEMAENFAKKYFVSKGYGVQVDIHPPNKKELINEVNEEIEITERNYHAHLLITERPFDETGLGFSNKKINNLGPEVRGSLHLAFNGIEWQKLWTQFQNEYFEKNGLDLRVDSPGLVAQIHLGPLRMRTKRAYEILGEYEKRDELAQLLALDPKIILQKLTENKSVFQESDLESFLQKNVSEQDKDQLRNSFWKSPHLIQLFDSNEVATANYTFQEVYEEERKILRLSDKLFHQKMDPLKHHDDPSDLTEEQRVAFKKIISGNHLACIEGLAGTGKSYLLVALKNIYEKNGYKVRAFGPDNATVKVLEEKGFLGARSVHNILFKNYFSKNNQILKSNEIWIVDEASKLGNRPLLELLKLAESNDIRIIFSGNSAQLSSVDRGGLFNVFCERYGCSFLEDVQRQNKLQHREISKRLAYGEVNAAINMIASSGGFIWSDGKSESLLKLMEKWAEDKIHFPYDSSLIIAHTNQEVRQLNDLAHTIRMARGEVSDEEFECHTIQGKIRISAGDVIEFRENSRKLNVKNGDKGILVKASENEFSIKLDDRLITFNPKKFSGFQLGYAVTYFRSQGDTVDRAYIAYSHLMSQKLLYVGRTRHVKDAYCFVSRTEAKNIAEIKKQMIGKVEQENTLSYTSVEEIENKTAIQNRKAKIQELCSSDNVLLQTKGYTSKVFDYVISGVHQFLEKINDRQLDKNFYRVPEAKQFHGRVVLIKEEGLSISNSIESNSPQKIEEKCLINSTSTKKNDFQKLPQEAKEIYKNYFKKIEIASSFYTIVQAESLALSVQKMNTPSFSEWQKACTERNCAANELLKMKGVNQIGVLGEKGYQILRERAETYNRALEPRNSIQENLLDNLDALLNKLFPEGPFRKDHQGFRFGSKGSLSVTCVGENKGYFYSFETKEKGNLIALIEKQCGLSTKEAIAWARGFLNDPNMKVAPSHFSTKQFSNFKEDKWTSVLIPAYEQMPELKKLSPYIESKYRLASVYKYYTVDGQVACYNLRLEDKETGGKIFLPLSYGKSHPDENPSWRLKGYSERNLLLYNAQLLNQYPDKPVLIVEGEKTADAASKLLGKDYVVVSWQGGAAAAREANWQLLNRRDVIIWPDNDAPGFKASEDIGDCLRRVGVKSMKMVNSLALKDFPPKWDLADTLPKKVSTGFIENTILRAENKAISFERLNLLAAEYNVSAKQLNVVVAEIDKNLRKNLEQKHGSKTWEIEAAILAEVSKYLEKNSSNVKNYSISLNKEEEIHKNKSIDISVGLDK
jgi:Ti-type conjugative transfer relaxase TraA